MATGISLLTRAFGRIGHSSDHERLHDWMRVLSAAVLLGVGIVGVYGFGITSSTLLASRVIASGLILAGAALVVGGLIGFLFGIPRTLQDQTPAPAPPAPPAANGPRESAVSDSNGQGQAPRYAANTNLEQISDWLTKILVGVGLTQLNNAPERLAKAAEWFAPSLSTQPHGKPFALASIIYFSTTGFLFAYLWTRLYLARALHLADMTREVKRELEEQAIKDANAISLTRQQLEPASGAPPVDQKQLREAIMGASPSVKVQIFYQASKLRSETWKTDKKKMERTIPIFEALCESDRERRFHKNFGQLGFALKDKQPEDWAGAEKMLTEAIRIRGPWREAGWTIYEWSRAVCRIEQDAAFKAGAPSTASVRQAIVADLAAVAESDVQEFLSEDPVPAWMRLNGVAQADLQAVQPRQRPRPGTTS